jgi:membrane protein DedA with SNARE-associated domain
MDAISGFFLANPALNPLAAAFLFLLLFGFVLPIPEELALVMTGIALRCAGRSFWAAMPMAFAALILADLGYYAIARFLGPRLLRLGFFRGILKPELLEALERYFARRGPVILFSCRFVLGLRQAAVLSSGLLKLPVARFLRYDAAALALCSSAWLAVGFALGLRQGAGVGVLERVLAVAAPIAAATIALAVYLGLRADRARAVEEEAREAQAEREAA